jgi:hypothetical protein
VNYYIGSVKIRATYLILSGALLVGCVNKPIINPGQPSAKVEFSAYISASLNLAGDVKCSSFLGLSTSSRDLTPIIYYNVERANSTNFTASIPVSDSQVFLVRQYVPQTQGAEQFFWFKFPIKANRNYFIETKRVVTKEGILIDDYFWKLSVFDENKQEIPYEIVPNPQDDPLCKKST